MRFVLAKEFYHFSLKNEASVHCLFFIGFIVLVLLLYRVENV